MRVLSDHAPAVRQLPGIPFLEAKFGFQIRKVHNRLGALEIRAQRAVERSSIAEDVRGSLAVV